MQSIRDMSTPEMLRAGAGQSDITPEKGIQIAGDIGRYRPTEEVREPIYAKALFVESGVRKLCIVSLDLCIITEKWASEIRRRAAELYGLEFGAVNVHATQTHSAPSLGHAAASEDCALWPEDIPWVKGGDDRYHRFAVERIMEAVRSAHEALSPVEIGAASGVEGTLPYNRRFVMRDGSTLTHPPRADPRIRYPEGKIDPELGVVSFRRPDGEVMALLLHFTCHPTHGYPQNFISPDWPGIWCEEMKKTCGENCIPIVINGCCGNIHHINHLDPDQVDDYHLMGQKLARKTAEIMPGIAYEKKSILDWKRAVLPVPWRPLMPQQLQEARDLLARHPEPMWLDDAHTSIDWNWMFAVSLVDLADQHQNKTHFDYEIQAFRIGDIALVAVGGEPFVEGQLRIKLESPAYPTYLIHMSNYYVGYVPTPEALQRGGYETRAGGGSKLAAEALDLIAAGSLDLLREVFAA